MIGDNPNPNFDCLLDVGPVKLGKSAFSINYRGTLHAYGKPDVMTNYYTGFFAMFADEFPEENY